MDHDKDILEKVLRDKLGELRHDLPYGMWERIEGSLAAGADAVRAGSFGGRVRVHRRAGRRGLGRKYVVAAAMIAVIVVVGRYSSHLTDRIGEHADGGVAMVPEAAGTHDVKETGTAVDVIAAADAAGVRTPATVRRRSKPGPDDGTAQRGEPRDVVAAGSGHTPATEERPAEDTARQTDRRRQVTADPGGGVREWWRGEDAVSRHRSGRGRLSAGVSSSLYASGVMDDGVAGVVGVTRSQNMFGIVEAMNTSAGDTRYVSPTLSRLKHKFPVSVGLDASYRLSDRWSLHSGVNYSFMRSEGTMSVGGVDVDATQELHYIGIPLAVSYDLVRSRGFDFYARGGGMIEKGLRRKVTAEPYWTQPGVAGKEKIKGVQPSLNLSVGGQANLSDKVGIYVEPGVSYYVGTSNQPANYRTENPFTLSLRAGVRFNIGR